MIKAAVCRIGMAHWLKKNSQNNRQTISHAVNITVEDHSSNRQSSCEVSIWLQILLKITVKNFINRFTDIKI